ncbi:MAG: L,D-transpeptidase [Puniceicoccales bacterium]|jgi:hypothetical protein|nr:L,D-transpeptidase [Puniceicoccales bacterium]
MQPLTFIYISISRQRLLLQSQNSVKEYVISTGIKSPGNIKDSFGTPLGWHEICEKYGDGAPAGNVFIGRVSQEKHFTQIEDWHQRNYVVTRILRMRGLEDGFNSGITNEGLCCDTFLRYVYIHGTCHEHALGAPSGCGCIVLSSDDVIELHSQTPLGTKVLICE